MLQISVSLLSIEAERILPMNFFNSKAADPFTQAEKCLADLRTRQTAIQAKIVALTADIGLVHNTEERKLHRDINALCAQRDELRKKIVTAKILRNSLRPDAQPERVLFDQYPLPPEVLEAERQLDGLRERRAAIVAEYQN